ncbi:sigma factor-like helix-turn-helix DNA-binding protein [Lentzea sp. JNUCC 0626]|uniref:sigma factor-like helix-turn-helix DNA-binding protein n=1 Tax=Lentzea sp. JNUCC 0626 TaxID=3367513 RepID=UPI003747D6AA
MTYTPELVEQLLPTVWDRTWAWGMANPRAPDPDMPRASNVISHGGTYWAHLADIRTAWDTTIMPREERAALLLRHGLGWTQEEIAQVLLVSQRAISKRLSRGLQRLVDHLND